MNLFNMLGVKKKNAKLSKKDRIVGCLYGYFVGDALGVPIEFNSRESLKKNPTRKMNEYGTHNQPKGTWSDDSSMVLATIDSMYNNKDVFLSNNVINYNDLMKRFLNWKLHAEYTPNNFTFDIGNSTSVALTKYENNNSNVFCGENNINSNGNGSLMRILPVSLCTKEDYDIIKNVSSLTHAHILSVMSCYIYSIIIDNYLETLDFNEAYKQTRQYCKIIFEGKVKKDYGDLECCKKYFNRLIYNDISLLKEEEIKSSGFVVDTLEATIWCILTSNSYKEAVLKAVNLGEDTDTIGALTGAIAGLIYGINDIPTNWLNQLQRKTYLDEMVNKYLELLQLKEQKIKKESDQNIAEYKEEMKRKKNIKATKESWRHTVMSDNIKELNINITLTNENMDLIKLGHIPLEMEDKWFMYVDEQDNSINYYNSWSGIQLFKGYYKQKENTIIYKLIINDSKDAYNHKTTDNELIDLFKNKIEKEIEYHKLDN